MYLSDLEYDVMIENMKDNHVYDDVVNQVLIEFILLIHYLNT